MSSPKTLLALSLLAACVDAPVSDTDIAVDDASTIVSGKSDAPGWEAAATLHANTRLFDFAGAGSRRVHSLWIAGTPATHVPVAVTARAGDGYNVRIAVLGPLDANGARPVLGADGYSARKREAAATIDVTQAGEHLVVVGSFGLETETFYELGAACSGPACTDARLDVLASPKHGALVGDADRLVQMSLGDVLAGYTGDVEVELWASPPMQHWNAVHVATSYASGTQVNAIAPSQVQPGDDLRLVVREAGGRVLDSGVTARFFPQQTAFARLDAILYGDIA